MNNISDPNQKRFFPAEKLEEHRKFCLSDTINILSVFDDMELPPDTHRPLHYFFSTDTREKGNALADELRQLGYWVEADLLSDHKAFIISGWSKKVLVSYPTIEDWTKKMVELGFKHDCRFDKWETFVPDYGAEIELPEGFTG